MLHAKQLWARLRFILLSSINGGEENLILLMKGRQTMTQSSAQSESVSAVRHKAMSDKPTN